MSKVAKYFILRLMTRRRKNTDKRFQDQFYFVMAEERRKIKYKLNSL